jgi:group I intron endonuclease
MIAYKITNKVNGKQYVGITTSSLNRRWNEHNYLARVGGDQYISRAIKVHGKSNFSIEQIASAIGNTENLKQLEIDLIEQYDTFYNGYNLTKGGDGNFGYVPSKENRERHSKFMTGRKASAETLKRMSEAHSGEKNAFYGKTHNEETRKRCGVHSIGNKNMLGKTHSQESRDLIKVARAKQIMPTGNQKGLIIATNIATGEQITLDGKKDMDAKGFASARVYDCVLKKRKTHKGFTFERIKK